jgi:cell shape-determining protein MreC
MKHLKTYESFEYEKINEELEIWETIKGIIKLPLIFLISIGLNFANPRFVIKLAYPLLDVYHNLKSLIMTFENILKNGDVTDTERKKIEKRLEELRKVKQKNPTLDDYKKRLARTMSILNIKNRNYLKEKIMDYQPKDMSISELVSQIKKVYAIATREDIKVPREEEL